MKCEFVNTFFSAEKYFWDFFSFFYQKILTASFFVL